MKRRYLSAACAAFLASGLAPLNGFEIDTDFPGGNAVVESVVGDTVKLKPDIAGHSRPWFYWSIAVRGAGGRTLTFVLDPQWIGVRGPGVSTDDGKSWSWLGAAAVTNGTFAYAFPPGADDVRFSVGMSYVAADFQRLMAAIGPNPCVHPGVLTRSRKGREVPYLIVRPTTGAAKQVVAFTARHHACEMMASYVWEGILTGVLAEDEAGRWLRENVEFLFVPFVDMDGVEDGDQGKNREPHDHNRDYAEEIYPEVAALKKELPKVIGDRPFYSFDLHDPALKRDIHETIHILEPEGREQAAELANFTAHLEREQQGPILYSRGTTMKFGAGYNRHAEEPPVLNSTWSRTLPTSVLNVTIETAYANASGSVVDQNSAREFGRDIAVGLKSYLQERTASGPATTR